MECNWEWQILHMFLQIWMSPLVVVCQDHRRRYPQCLSFLLQKAISLHHITLRNHEFHQCLKFSVPGESNQHQYLVIPQETFEIIPWTTTCLKKLPLTIRFVHRNSVWIFCILCQYYMPKPYWYDEWNDHNKTPELIHYNTWHIIFFNSIHIFED